MVKLVKDDTKLPREEILQKPGRLASQIIHNELIESQMFFWSVGNIQGNQLYTVVLNNGEKSIIGHTSEDLLISYVNRPMIKKSLLNSFGKSIVLVNMSFKNLKRVLSTTFAGFPSKDGDDLPINTVIMNPNSKDFFVPFNIMFYSNIMEENIELIDRDIHDVELTPMKYDKEDKLYKQSERNDGYLSLPEDI
jgi:hypothetical protein